MKQHDIREEVERYIQYLNKIKNMDYPSQTGENTEQRSARNSASAEKRGQLNEVVKSLQAILSKTEKTYY